MTRKPDRLWLLLCLTILMLTSAWMTSDKCCIPKYAKGALNQKMIIVALELTPTYEGWNRYLVDTTCHGDSTGQAKKETKLACLRTQIERDLAFIASYTLLFVMLVWKIFQSEWKRTLGWILAGLIAAFDLLENIFIHFILKGFENIVADADKISHHTAWMFDVSLSKWTLILVLVLWMFHTVVRWQRWWVTSSKAVLFGAILLFLIMPVWDLEQSVQVPSAVLVMYFGLIIFVLIYVLIFNKQKEIPMSHHNQS